MKSKIGLIFIFLFALNFLQACHFVKRLHKPKRKHRPRKRRCGHFKKKGIFKKLLRKKKKIFKKIKKPFKKIKRRKKKILRKIKRIFKRKSGKRFKIKRRKYGRRRCKRHKRGRGRGHGKGRGRGRGIRPIRPCPISPPCIAPPIGHNPGFRPSFGFGGKVKSETNQNIISGVVSNSSINMSNKGFKNVQSNVQLGSYH